MSMQHTSIQQSESPGSKGVPEQVVETIQSPVEPEGRAKTTPPVWQAPPVSMPPAQPPYRGPIGTPGAYPPWQTGYRPPRKSLGRNPWFWIGLSLILILLLAGGATALVSALGGVLGGSTGQVVTTHTYNVSEHPRLVITNNTGKVQVRASSSARTISIQETKYTGVGSDQRELVVSYSQESANNTVTVNVTRTTSPNLFNVPRAEFEVTVPATSDLALTTNNENIDVSGISGHMVLNSNNGSITVKDGTLSTSSTLISNNGSVTFTGSIAASGAYTIESNTNSVHVNLPAEPGFRVDATADTGSISTNFPGLSVEHPSSTGAQLHGSVGASPTATLLLTSHTGSITLYQR